jgi:hypothetical protein
MTQKISGIQPLKSGNLERREVFEEVGRAIVHLSDIENLLASLFHVLVRPKAPSPSMELFYDQGTFDKKMKLVDFIFHLRGSKKELERWKKISAQLDAHRSARNLIAHYGMYVDSPDRDGRVDVVLHPPWLKGGPIREKRIFVLLKSAQRRAHWTKFEQTWRSSTTISTRVSCLNTSATTLHPTTRCGEAGGIGRRRQVAQRRMRALAVVIVGPNRNFGPGVIEAVEQSFVEKLVAHPTVEACE